MARISFIIPTLNEEQNLQRLLPCLRDRAGAWKQEIIVVDAGSKDATAEVARQHQARFLASPTPGRAAQMNFGARQAQGDILHFIHADSLPAPGFARAVVEAFHQGCEAGCLRNRFDTRHRGLLLCSYLSRFRGLIFRGGGQTLFTSRRLFERVGGYDERLDLMEEYDLIRKLARQTRFTVLPFDALVSVRKHRTNGHIRLQLIYACIMGMYFAGASQERMKRFHKRFVSSGAQQMKFEMKGYAKR